MLRPKKGNSAVSFNDTLLNFRGLQNVCYPLMETEKFPKLKKLLSKAPLEI